MKTTFVLDVSPPARLRKGQQSPARLFGRYPVSIVAIRRACLAIAALAWTICCGDSRAWSATDTWTGTGTNWSDASNWGGAVPGSSDIGLFSAASYTSQPSLVSPAAVAGIWDTGSGTITVGGSSALTLFGTTINSNTGTGIEIDAGAGPLTINAPLFLQNNQQWINNSASALTVNGAISGTGSLTMIGSGTWTLTGVNTSSGSLTVDGGTLQIPSGSLASPNQYVGYSGTGSFIQSGGNNTVTASGFANGLLLAYNGGSRGYYTLNDGRLSAVNQYIGYQGNAVFTQNGGTNSVSTYLSVGTYGSGTYNLSAGSLSAPQETIGDASGSVGSFTQTGGTNTVSSLLYVGYNNSFVSTYALGSGQLSAPTEEIGVHGTGIFMQTGGTNTITSSLQLGINSGSSGTYNLFGGLLVVPSILQGSGGSLSISGGTLSGGASGLTISLPNSPLTLAGPIVGSGGLVKTGSATLTLSGNNTYTGDTTVSQGAVLVSNSNAVQNTTVVVGVDNGLLFSGGIGAFNVGSISGSGNVALSDTGGNPVTLVSGGNNANTTYSGLISGSGTLVHNGSGTLLLTASNTYAGGTILGPDAISSNYPLPGTTTFTANATLQAAASTFAITNNVVIDANATATIDTAGYTVPVSGAISGAGNLNKAGTGTLILANANTYSGDTTISQGTLQLASAAAVQNSTVSVNVDNGLQFSSGIGTFDVGGLSGSNSLTLSDTGGGPVTLAVGGNNANTTFSGSIGGSGGLAKAGSGALTLTGSNSFRGGLTLDPGMVSITSDAALGAVPQSPTTDITFAANSTLQAGGSFALAVNRSIAISSIATATFDTSGNTLAIGGQISGNGALTKTGCGTLVLSGSDSYRGGTTVDAGTLCVTNSIAIAEGTALTVDAGGIFVFDPAANGAPTAGAMPPAASPGVHAVPEPPALVLLLVALCSAAVYRPFRHFRLLCPRL